MFSRRSDSTDTTTETVKGPSLARGPAWIVGSVLAVFGLLMFFEAPGTPLSTSGFPDAAATGGSFLGFEVNAWTAWMTIAAGVFVLIGAAQHLAARTFSLIAGLALGAMAILALIDGDVLGLAAANGWTIVGWAIASGVLLITSLLPRIRHERTIEHDERHRIADRDRARIAERDQERTIDRDRSVDRDGAPAAADGTYRDPARRADAEHADSPRQHAVTYGDNDRTAGGEVPMGAGAHPSGARSEPLRRTYDGPAQTQAEREAEAEAAAADRGRTRSH